MAGLLAKLETAMRLDRNAAQLKHMQGMASPERLDSSIAEQLRRTKGGDFALARLRAETALFDELSAQQVLCGERLFALGEEEERLRIALYERQQKAQYQKVDAGAAARTEAELAEVAEQGVSLRARDAALGSRVGPLRKRLELCKRRISGGALRFVAPPHFDQTKVTLDGMRKQIAQLAADEREIRAAPRTAAEVKALVDRWIEREMRRPGVTRLFDPQDDITGPFLPGPGGIRPDPIGFLLWACRGEIAKQLHADVDRLADKDRRALSESVRTEKLARCRKEIIAGERIEEALAWQLMQAGEAVVLRPARPPRDFDGNPSAASDGVSVEAILSIEQQ